MNEEYLRCKKMIDSLASTLGAGKWQGSGDTGIEIANAINKAEAAGKLSVAEKMELVDYLMRQIDMAAGVNPADSSHYSGD